MNWKNRFLMCCTIALSLALIRQSSADECDPGKILIADSAKRSVLIKEKLDQKSSTDSADSKKESSSGGFNYLDIISATGGENVDFTSTLKKTFSSMFEGQYQSAESYLQLSDNAKDAYKACLEAKTKHLFVYPSNSIMDAVDTFVEVKLESYIEPRLINVDVSVDGAALATGQKKTITMTPGGTANVRVKRDLDKPFTVHVQAGNETEYLSVPARDKNKLVRELRYSKPAAFGHAVNGQRQTHQMCVQISADDDAILIPGSAAMVTPLRTVSSGGVFTDVPVREKIYDPKTVCRQGDAFDDGTNGVNISVCAYVVAEVIARIPRDDAKSKFANTPAYAADGSQCK